MPFVRALARTWCAKLPEILGRSAQVLSVLARNVHFLVGEKKLTTKIFKKKSFLDLTFFQVIFAIFFFDFLHVLERFEKHIFSYLDEGVGLN